jgi:DNA-binding MurR/RpiR family transcriptional regulator
LKSVKRCNELFHMSDDSFSYRSFDDLIKDLAKLARDGSPAIARLANWCVGHPKEIAFQSVRGLAELADANVNTVYRLAIAMGFSGYEECRKAFQAALREPMGLYATRVEKLTTRNEGDLIDEVRTSSHENLETALSGENVQRIREAADRLSKARRIYCIGVRASFSLAHYLSYTGGMAFDHFERPFVEPGSIADALAQATADDVVVLITFSLYSAEVVRAHSTAVAKGLGVIAITDTFASPIAQGADLVFCLPMAGPQPLPSHGAGFALVEAITTEMILANEGAAARIARFERTMLELGSYVSQS